ncbi:MAG: FGGY-family carbohydrate kinase [Anaerovoracaceae bacterium]
MHGNRCPFDDANSRGVFFNLDITTKGSDLMKSVIEGVCMHMLWLLQATEKTFKTNPVVRFSGGSAISPFICQVMADVLGRDVETIENPRQVGAMGAAALMAVSFGMLDDIKDIKKIIKVSATYHPNQENHAVYQKPAVFKIFIKTIRRRSPLSTAKDRIIKAWNRLKSETNTNRR